jgi:hypothetical protein
MANSKIIITFEDIPVLNSSFRIFESSLSLNMLEAFKTNRIAANQVKIPQLYDIGEPGEPVMVRSGFVSENYKTAFNLDHNSTGLFTVTSTNGASGSGLGTVTIEANYGGAEFSTSSLPAGVSVEIINEEAAPVFEVTNIEFSESEIWEMGGPCSDVMVTVTTSILAGQYSYNGVEVLDNTDNPFTFRAQRNSSLNLGATVSGGFDFIVQPIITPSLLSEFNFSLSFINSPNGSTVTVSNVNTSGLDLEYSLDGDTWQTSNIFSGLTPDDYTLHVRDHLGCSFTKDFTVSDNNVNVPFFAISKSNSIRFAQRITFGDSANYKTDENTLSCEVEVGIPYHEVQLFQTADVITTQFKSNYGNHSVKVVREDLSEISVPVTQVTSFRGLKDKRDARKYDLGNGKVGIYFTSGNIYDYDTGVANAFHNLNGLVPEWGLAGNYVSIGSSWFLIERVFFDENKNADVLVITESFALSELTVIVGSVYDVYPFDVFQFDIDMSAYIDESIKVRIDCTDDNFQSIQFLSEQIDVAVRHVNTLDINYWNDENNDVYYASGIRHRIRPIYTKIEGVVEQESTMHKTDTSALLLSADLYEGDRFIFEPTTKEIWRKLMAALSHKNVYINGVKYIKNGDFETDGPLEDSNLYVLKATMLKGGGVYNSDGSTFGAGNASNAEIPGFIEGDNGFIAY